LDLEGFEVGEKIFVNPVVPCGECYYCKQGLHGLCIGDKSVFGTEIQGGFAEFLKIPEVAIENGQLFKIPENESYEETVITELLSSVYHSQEFADISLGDTVVVIGLGPIGGLQIDLAKLRGAKEVIAIDISSDRLELAQRFNADYYINSSEEDPIKKVKEITDGYGAEKVIVACPSTEAQGQAVYMTKKRGKVVIFGGVPKEDPYNSLDSNYIHYNEIEVVGAYAFNQIECKNAFELVMDGKIKAEKFITHRLPLEDIEKGIDIITSGKGIKVLLKP